MFYPLLSIHVESHSIHLDHDEMDTRECRGDEMKEEGGSENKGEGGRRSRKETKKS
jgi:hypothetical protein